MKVSSFPFLVEERYKKENSFGGKNEPISVLDTRSPSPSTSTSTLSSLENKASLVPVSLPPETGFADVDFSPFGLEDWGSLLQESLGQDQIFQGSGLVSVPNPNNNFTSQSSSFGYGAVYPQTQILNMNQSQMHITQFEPGIQNFGLQIPKVSEGYHHQKQAVYEQLHEAVEVILTGNFSHAQMILARLNQYISPLEKPFQRAAFYFKEALETPLLINSKVPTPFDGMFKMGAYRVLSEVSPIIQFTNFTANQVLLEALSDARNIHIVDFDIGFGAQWASFMQELPRGTNLKITAFASPTTHHPLELGLMHENLSNFANEIGVSFKLEVVNIDSFDPNSHSVSHEDNEAIAVNFPIGSCSGHLFTLPSILRFINQLSPRIMVSMERACEKTELPFVQHILHALNYYELLLESIDAANVTSDTANKIERFLFQPMIERMVLGRLRAPDPMPHWKSLFVSAGFSPVSISSFAEAQADCLAKRTPVRGFHVEKREGLLVLSWQRRELVSASAWKC